MPGKAQTHIRCWVLLVLANTLDCQDLHARLVWATSAWSTRLVWIFFLQENLVDLPVN